MPFQKGNKLAESNAKELRLSTWVQKELERDYDTSHLEGYEEKMAAVKVLARRIVDKALKAENLKDLIDGAEFIRDTTEGKPKQVQELTGKDGEDLKVTFTIED